MQRGKRILSMVIVLCLITAVTIYQPDLFAFGDESSTNGTSSDVDSLQNQSGIQKSIPLSALISNVVGFNIPPEQESSLMPETRLSGETILPPADTIGIYTAQDLSDMRMNLSGNYTLMNDIDLTTFTAVGDGWIPVGTSEGPFTGTLDGNGHSITGLRIYKYSQNTTSFVGGLFGYGVGMTVKNLSLSGEINTVAARAGRYLYLGGIIGYADMVTISGCTVGIKVKAKAETTDIGGLIGHAISSVEGETGRTIIENCTTSGEINTSGRAYDLGGVIGEGARLSITNTVNNVKAYGLCTAPDKVSTAAGIVGRFTSGSIVDCTNNGIITTDVSNIYMTNTSEAYAGGIAAMARLSETYYDSRQIVEISGCLNTGTLNSDRMGTITQAGIVVVMSGGRIENCENQGSIKNFTSYSGGAYGIVANSGMADIISCINKGDILCTSICAAGITDSNYTTISECSNWGTITSMDKAAGIAIMNVVGTISNCMNAGDISGSIGSFQAFSGGIVSANKSIIKNCYNIGTIRGSSTGGIAHSNEANGIVETSMNAGNVYSPNGYGGAIVGNNHGFVTNSYYESGIVPGCANNYEAAQDNSKGLNQEEWKTKESYVGFDFIDDDTPADWSMSSNTGWPILTAVEEVYVNGLSVAQAPKKVSYLINEKIDTKGLILKATLSNGRVQYLDTGYILGTYAKTSGTRAISVRYAGKTTNFNVRFLYFTVEINESSLMDLDCVDFPGVVKMRYYTASTATGPYSIWMTGTPMDATDTSIITNDLILNKTYYFKVQPIYASGPGPVYGYNAIRFKPAMPEILDFYRDETGVRMNCMPVRYVDGFETYCATSIGGPYTKIGESTGFSMFFSGLKQGTFYFFVVRSYIYKDGVRVYSDYSPVQWGRFL